MNGDILTTLDYGALIDIHREAGNVLTIASTTMTCSTTVLHLLVVAACPASSPPPPHPASAARHAVRERVRGTRPIDLHPRGPLYAPVPCSASTA